MTNPLEASLQNFMLIMGCRPGLGVKADTKMVPEIVKRMLERYCRATFQLIIPRAYEDLAGSDVDFEVIASQSLPLLSLTYAWNTITRTLAVLFITTKWWGCQYQFAFREENRVPISEEKFHKIEGAI